MTRPRRTSAFRNGLLEVAVLALRETADGGAACASCGGRFDLMGLVQLVKAGRLERATWFDKRGRQRGEVRAGEVCPVCGAITASGPQALLGAKIALMRPDGLFVDVADGAQLSRTAPLLWQLEPLYSADGYLWVRPEHVIEVAYQDLYTDRARPLYRFDGTRYAPAGQMVAVCLRPSRADLRPDKAVNPVDLRLEQLETLVGRIQRIRQVTA